MFLPSILIGSVLIGVLAFDRLFMPKQARRAWLFMAITFATAFIFLIMPDTLAKIAATFGIGRGVDLLMYVLFILIVRELILNRSKQSSLERQITILTRKIAIDGAKTGIPGNSTSK